MRRQLILPLGLPQKRERSAGSKRQGMSIIGASVRVILYQALFVNKTNVDSIS